MALLYLNSLSVSLTLSLIVYNKITSGGIWTKCHNAKTGQNNTKYVCIKGVTISDTMV